MNHYDIPPLEKMRIERLCRDETSTEGFCAGLGVARRAQQGIRSLQEISDVFIVTAPWNSRHWTFERDNWLFEHFDVPRKHIIHTDAKFIVSGDYFIDDKLAHIHAWCEEFPLGKGILWGMLYNENVNIPANACKLSDWDEVIRIVGNWG